MKTAKGKVIEALHTTSRKCLGMLWRKRLSSRDPDTGRKDCSRKRQEGFGGPPVGGN